MIKKFIIKEINELRYTLVDNNEKEYIITAIFNEYKPVVNDIIYMSDSVIMDNTILDFGKLTYDDIHATEEDIIKIVCEKGTINLQRYYG